MFDKEGKCRELTKEEESVIIHKGTERPFSGKFYAFWKRGIYVCRRCGAKLYRSESKFEGGVGGQASTMKSQVQSREYQIGIEFAQK